MLQNKKVVITGAGRGIGRVLALGFAQQGADVLVHYAHTDQGAEQVVREIKGMGGNAIAMQADLSHVEEVKGLVTAARVMMGPIDIWINNAGASANSSETEQMSEVEIFDRLMQVDVRGTWLCSREVRPHMPEGSCILTIGWDGALTGRTGLPSQLYSMSKAAVMALTRSLASEYAPDVRVNCIAPGYIENEWSRSNTEVYRRKIAKGIPLQRWGTADDILGAALFLVSPDASFITGQIIVVDGGEVMR